MSDRYQGIEKAHRSVVDTHKSTFDWVYERPGSGFVDWLEDGHDIFWINGKAGSGKSTLMRFIRDDARLIHHLQATAPRGRQLIIADFYFWAAGSLEQRSQLGLLMTMLYRVLIQAKHLLPIIAPEQWEHAADIAARIVEDTVWYTPKQRTLRIISTTKAVLRLSQEYNLVWTRQALLRLFHEMLMALDSSTQLFILIDGLDEYESKEEEMEDLVALLKRIGQKSNVKICISTRPWPVFEINFGRGQYPTLQLQDFTYDDISIFVRDSFDRSNIMQTVQQAYPKSIPDFFSSITVKAEGVFLWVRLVVRSLLRGLQNGDELSDLQQQVDELPEDLERLYMHMLDRVKQKYWSRSSKMFAIAGAASEPPSALTIWYSGEPEANPLEEITAEVKVARCYQVHLRLMNQCAGLLELRYHGYDDDQPETDMLQLDRSWSYSDRQHYLQSVVHYLHRTTKDFLNRTDIALILRERIDGKERFDPHEWLALHFVIKLSSATANIPRYEDADDIWEMEGFQLSNICGKFAFHARRCENRQSAACLRNIRNNLLARIGLACSGGGVHMLRSQGPTFDNDTKDIKKDRKNDDAESCKDEGISDNLCSSSEALETSGRNELIDFLRRQGVKIGIDG